MSKKTLYFDEYCGYSMAVAVENGKISEFDFEKKDNISLIGNVYKGKVKNVLPGMNAAFINCGLGKNCYLSAEDIYPDSGKYECENGEKPAFPALKEGDEIAVQVVKAPVGTKGARVTAFFSFVGKYFIYMPNTPFIGVSRKICDSELRKTLMYSVKGLKTPEEGLVFRTAAPYAKRERLEAELNYLRNMYKSMREAFKTAKVGTLLYSEINLHMRVMRDTLSSEIDKIVVGTPKLDKLINSLVSIMPPANRKPVVLYDGFKDMMDYYGLSEQICEISSPKVALDNGAYLVIENTEALTVVDVNTGKFTGDDSLEQTVYYTNILAAREIARQVKLRNIGGIVVVDFIDMTEQAHRTALVEELERALKQDSAKCAVSPMSRFGLVEFTRKRTGGSPLSVMTKCCRHCGNGRVKTPRYTLLGMRAALLSKFLEGERRMRIDMNVNVFEELAGWDEFKEELSHRLQGAEVHAVPHRSFSEEQLCYRFEDIAPLPENSLKIV